MVCDDENRDDCADARVHLMQNYTGAMPINVGNGTGRTILELAKLISKIVGFSGDIRCDPEKPDGTPGKLLDCTRLHELRWSSRIVLEEGVAAAYRDFINHRMRFPAEAVRRALLNRYLGTVGIRRCIQPQKHDHLLGRR
jgi:nucleoside-diphosphate-sugar epimerase